MIRNQSWYDLNESRPWPISDEATAVADDGTRFPNRALADLHLAFPQSVAQRAFISAVAITPTLATVTILGTESTASPSSYLPLAAVSLVKPIDPYRMYPLEALMPGVGGWIVFGYEAARDDANVESFHARFSTPAQSIIQPSCTRAYRDLPVASIGRLGAANPLTGLIRLSGGNDLEVVKECREIPLVPGTGCDVNISAARDVIVIRLKETIIGTTAGGVPAAQPADNFRNVYDVYKGPCAGRPESVSCGDPQPIELLASVPPDCCGNIDLVLRGCATPSRITQQALVVDDIVQSVEETCGVIIDCELSLAEACITPDRLPGPDGTLPNEYDDLCESASSVSVTLPPVADTEESFSVLEESQSAEAASNPELPFCDNFSTNNADLAVTTGIFGYNTELRRHWSTEGAYGQALRNVSVWDFDFDSFFKRVYTQVVLLPGSSGSLHNAAVIANYHETGPGTGKFAYYVAEIDYDGSYQGYKIFRIGRFNGAIWNTEFAVPVPTLALNNRYDLYLTIHPVIDRPTSAWLTARLVGQDDSIDLTIGPLLENDYDPSVGKFGMGTNRAASRFYHFCVENTGEVTNGPPAVEP